MAINFASVRDSLYQWAVSQVPAGMPVIYWQPNAPRPTIPYITLFISQVTAVNQDWSDHEATGLGIINMRGNRQFTLEVQSYGSDPLTIVENLRTSLQKQTVLDTLRVNGIAFYSSLTINDITELVDSKFERRAALDILFGVGQVYTDTPGFFDQVELTEVVDNVDGVEIYNDSFLIPDP
jgi:hypothetical protein